MKPWDNQRMIMLCLVGVLAILVFSINPLGASAADFFVATTGNNSNSGSIGSPFLTLEKAASVMAPGDTMFIRAGTYQRTAEALSVPSGGGTWETATKVEAYDGETVILTPQNPVMNGTDVIQLPNGKSYIIFNGLILDGLRSGETNGGKMGFRFSTTSSGANPSHHIRIINTEIRNTAQNIIYTGSATNNEFINLNLHHGVRSNVLTDGTAGPYGIYMESGNNLMQGCEIHHNRGFGVHNYSGHTWQPNNNTYIGNKIHHNGRSGFLIASSTGTALINNLVYENGTGEPEEYTGFNRFGFQLQGRITNLKMYNNISYNHPAGELFMGPSVPLGIVASNNILYATGTGYGVHVYGGSTGGTVTNNLIYHPNASFLIRNDGTATISSNVHGDPLFINAGEYDFRLQSGSPAIGKGIVLNEVKVDFDNVQRNQPYDFGAYVFDSSSLPVTTRPASPKNVQVF